MEKFRQETKIENTIDDVIDGDTASVDSKLKDIFIDDNKTFENDDITEDDKEFIRSLISKTNFFTKTDKVDVDDDGDFDFMVDKVNVAPPINIDK